MDQATHPLLRFTCLTTWSLPCRTARSYTFGSDMKYHVHLHSLLTFGGIDKDGQWLYPKHKKKLFKHVDYRNTFRNIFINLIYQNEAKGKLVLQDRHQASIAELKDKKWAFHVTKPAMSTQTIELYLAKYINRIAVTNSRLKYLKKTKEVRLVYNDYRHQNRGQVAPQKTKSFDPILFMQQYLMHVLPPYFQKSRRYGIHASAAKKKYSKLIESKLRKNKNTIRTVIEIITHLLKVPTLRCANCQHQHFDIQPIRSDTNYIYSFLTIPNNRSP